ncbi:unnamed protein product, partial [Ectocarpus sp. 4 AP-2014]
PAVAVQKHFLGSFGRMRPSLRAKKPPTISLFLSLFFLCHWFVETAPNKTDERASFSTLFLCRPPRWSSWSPRNLLEVRGSNPGVSELFLQREFFSRFRSWPWIALVR